MNVTKHVYLLQWLESSSTLRVVKDKDFSNLFYQVQSLLLLWLLIAISNPWTSMAKHYFMLECFLNYPRNVIIYLLRCTVSVAYHLVENYRGNLILQFHWFSFFYLKKYLIDALGLDWNKKCCKEAHIDVSTPTAFNRAESSKAHRHEEFVANYAHEEGQPSIQGQYLIFCNGKEWGGGSFQLSV